ncbi:hypothetical protein GGR50DRAFT_699065 [Xylaria sp. CBS 124048]|nr:hypothetical protein GGR50DRAFT_699065 [Xylaria sp. CBS 124048]
MLPRHIATTTLTAPSQPRNATTALQRRHSHIAASPRSCSVVTASQPWPRFCNLATILVVTASIASSRPRNFGHDFATSPRLRHSFATSPRLQLPHHGLEASVTAVLQPCHGFATLSRPYCNFATGSGASSQAGHGFAASVTTSLRGHNFNYLVAQSLPRYPATILPPELPQSSLHCHGFATLSQFRDFATILQHSATSLQFCNGSVTLL